MGARHKEGIIYAATTYMLSAVMLELACFIRKKNKIFWGLEYEN